MLRYLIAGLFILATVVIAYVGCGPRAQVAGKKMLDQIDGILGKLDVQLAKVESAYTKVKEDTAKLREERIRAQVNLDSLNKKRDELRWENFWLQERP